MVIFAELAINKTKPKCSSNYWRSTRDRRNLLEHWQGWRSLDLHPREQIWVKLEDKLGRSVLHSKEILWAELQKTWENINVEVQRDEMLSCRRRMNQIIKVDKKCLYFQGHCIYDNIYIYMVYSSPLFQICSVSQQVWAFAVFAAGDRCDRCLPWMIKWDVGGWFGSITAEI